MWLDAFRDRHAGERITVCGCGVSAREVAAHRPGITIGVNDIGRLFEPSYLVVVNPREQFRGDRFQYIERSTAPYLFTHLSLGRVQPQVVRFRLGRFAGTDLQGGVLHYTQNSPYVAVCLAAFMGARHIGLIGVDFTEDHFFAPTGAHPLAGKLAEIDAQYGQLACALAERGVELVNLSRVSRLTSLPREPLGAAIEAGAPRESVLPAAGPCVPVVSAPRKPPRASMHICIENHRAGVISDLFDALGATACALGHRVTRGARRAHDRAADLHIVWNGRQYRENIPALFCEHGWLPRSDYQISARGINASSHVASFEWNGEPLPAEASAEVEARLARLRAAAIEAGASGASPAVPKEGFLIVPLQMELDTNILRHAPAHLRRMQAFVDYVSHLNPPWPVLFKQHPSDARRVSQHLHLVPRRRQDHLWPHSKGSIHSLLRTPACRGIVTINSNVAHDGLLWDVPAIVLGRNVWPASERGVPFLTSAPADWSLLAQSAATPEAVSCRRAYAHYLMSNQWTLAMARDPQRVASLLSNALVQRQVVRHAPVQKVTSMPARPLRTTARPVLNVVAENRGWLFELWKQRFRDASRADLVVAVSEKPLKQADAWLFIRARESAASPDPARTVVQIHDWQGPSAYAEGGERACVRQCGAIALTHPAQREILEASGIKLDQRRWFVQPVGFLACSVGPRAAAPNASSACVAWVGRPARRGREDHSGFDFFASAATSFGRNVKVALIGEHLEDAAAQLRKRRVDCVTHPTSRYRLGQCGEWIREFDCVVITSEADAGPWPLFEALHAGVPVVARPVGWARDLLSDGACGRTVQDSAAMGEAVARILEQRAQWRERGQQLRTPVAQYSVEAWVQANVALALTLVNARPRFDAATPTPLRAQLHAAHQ